MSQIEQGTAECPKCGNRADVTIVNDDFHLTCDGCGWELWGELSEADRAWLAIREPGGKL